MPSYEKRSRSEIQVSLMASLGRGTMRLIVPRSVCANRLEPTQSWPLTMGCWTISQERAL